jgi:DNA-directed RNA polymerase specialized sigma24 family protein
MGVSQDNAEFAEFFAAAWDPCLRVVAASTGNMTLAEDQTAEAFALAWASWNKVSNHPAPRAWVVRTALNAGASWWHRRNKETALTSYDIASTDSRGTSLDTAVLTARCCKVTVRSASHRPGGSEALPALDPTPSGEATNHHRKWST